MVKAKIKKIVTKKVTSGKKFIKSYKKNPANNVVTAPLTTEIPIVNKEKDNLSSL